VIVANDSIELVRTMGRTSLIMAFNNLLNEIIFIIIDDLGSKNLSLLLRMTRLFITILIVKFYDMALTYIWIGEEIVLL